MAGLQGRPRKNPEDRKDKALRVRFTQDELTWIQSQARAADLRVAAWIRKQILKDRQKALRPTK